MTKISNDMRFSKIRILIVVGNNPDDIVSRMADAKAADYEVLTAANTAETIDKAHASLPDVILVDADLPGMDSFDLIKRLKNDPQTQPIPVLLLTPLQAVENREKGLASGADDFLSKPVEPNELLARVNSLAKIGKLEAELKLRTRLENQSTGRPVIVEKKAIQIIADDHQLVSNLRNALARGDYSPIHADSAQQGLEDMKTSTPDLLIIDLQLADMDALLLLEKLKHQESSKDIPVLIISDADDAESRIRGINIGADDYLIKPVNSHEFIARVEAALRRKARQENIESKLQMLFTQSITDSMTGLFNRLYLYMNLEEHLHHAVRYKRTFSLFIIDIDNFKHINDTYGHLTGDDVLKKLAEILKTTVRSVDVCARFGGEEFVVSLPETDYSGAMLLAEKLRSQIADTHFPFIEGEQLTVSIGVTEYASGDKDINSVINRADEALYKAKKDGKNRVCLGLDND